MTKRDGDLIDKMTKMDQVENSWKKSPSRTENAPNFAGSSDVHSPGKNSRQSSSGSFSEFSASSFRDSPRSAPSSLPGSRCGSTPGSLLPSRSNSQESIIDLFDSMSLQLGQQLSEGQGIQLFSPKPRPLRHPKWSWQERVRVNHAVWRSWHMQYVKGKRPVICQFSAPTPDARQRLQADVIQGRPINKQWNPTQISSAIRDYHKWRVFSRDIFMGDVATKSAEDNAINLDVPHPPLSPMSAQKLMNDDTLKDFSDTLFISTERKNFTVPAPKKITRHVYNSDIIQPGLMQLEPDLDQDFMDTLDSLQDILSKTPTKNDTESMGMNYNLPPNFLADTPLGAFSEAMEIVDAAKNMPQNTTTNYPTAIIANMGSKSVVSQRQVTFAATPTKVVSSHYDPMVSGGGTFLPNFSTSASIFSSVGGGGSAGVMIPQPSMAPNAPGMYVAGTRGTTNVQFCGAGQAPNLIHVLNSNSAGGTGSCGGASGAAGGAGGNRRHSSQQPVPMVTTSYQSSAPTSPLSSSSQAGGSQGYTMGHSKLGVHSPGPTSPPACIQGAPMSTSPTTIGVISEAIDLLSCQIPSSPSKMISEWNQPLATQRGTGWAPQVVGGASSPRGVPNVVDPCTQPKTSMASTTFVQELSYGLDPMGPMDQSTVLGHRGPYGADLSPRQPRQQQQLHQQGMGLEVAGSMREVDGMQQGSEELMDFEQQFPSIAMATGASGMTAYKQPKREVSYSSQSNSKASSRANSRPSSRPSSRANSRANSRAGSRANSPRASYAGLPGQPFQDSLQAALQGKSDAKDLGLRSPTADRDLTISVPSSCQASTASSAASSPGSQIDFPETPTSIREYEFHTPRPKRQKTPDSNTKEKDARRRLKHLHSEHKRRFHIQSGLDELQGMIPGMMPVGDGSSKVSTAMMLQKAHEYIIHLKEETNSLRNEVESTKQEVQNLNDEICDCQDSLPDTGAPVNSQSERQLQQMCNDYISQQMRENWKYWIFSMLVRPLFKSYVAAVCTNPGANFDEEVIDWVEESCRLKPLRKLVYTIVRQVSTRTSVLQNPVQLQQQVEEIIQEEIKNPPGDQS
ncbi:MLX-interacting protein-like [Diadema setosum]|uniref:MLX-interacting protein-like n=1 Tax=Diadema setosum TaxID=31175 RepID=UPI003B3A3D01